MYSISRVMRVLHSQACPHKAQNSVDFDGTFLCKSHMSVALKRKLGILCGATLPYLSNGCMKYTQSGYYKMCKFHGTRNLSAHI